MAEASASIRDNGPYLLRGDIELLDADGQPFPIAAKMEERGMVALCRCGHSASKPFCDGAHMGAGFESAERAPSE